MRKSLKVSEVIDAIEKNGYPQIQEYLFEYDNGDVSGRFLDPGRTVVGACALGQAILNLNARSIGIFPGSLAITEWNDHDHLTCAQIAEKFREKFSDYLDRNVTVLYSEDEDEH